MVLEGDSGSDGGGFIYQHHLLDGHFFTLICCKICNFFKKKKINEKEAVCCQAICTAGKSQTVDRLLLIKIKIKILKHFTLY